MTRVVIEMAQGRRGWPAAFVFAIYLAGSLLLPIAAFRDWGAQPDAMVLVPGIALPSGLWLNRMTLLAPIILVLAIGTALRDGQWPTLHWLDGMVVLWVLTPILVGIANDSPFSSDLLQSVYLGLTWGAPYAAGRLVCRKPGDLRACLYVIIGFGIVTLGMAFVEFAFGRFWYAAVYGFHPYQLEGAQRYFGYRPLLLFEDPNQIAMWWATVALASLTLLFSDAHTSFMKWMLVLLALPSFLFQAIGAGLLTLFGVVLIRIPRRRIIIAIMAAILVIVTCLLVFRGPILRSGRQFTESSAAGHAVKQFLRNSSIGSFGWRLGLEEENEALLRERIWFGWGDVNYWHRDDASQRPWGLATLVTGAYGVIGFSIWIGMTLVPCGLVFARGANVPSVDSLPLRGFAVIILVNTIDASMNSAYLLPTFFFVGLVGCGKDGRRELLGSGEE